ncbi:hypothetical protein ACOMHN_002306 [Nucella lapillus]
MGLLPSSRRRQSRDLGDSAADDIYIDGPGADRRRGRSWRGSHQENSVRLVRTRTLSTDLDDGRVAGTANSGLWSSSLVLQKGAVGEEREVRKLLMDTQPVARWQQRLRRLLSGYIMPLHAYQALAFLEKNMDTAIVAVEDPSQSLGYPALFIDITPKPQLFDLQHWKDILIALHFDITEPEGNHDLDLVEVKVTRQVTLGSLLGFKFLLQCLSNVSWDMLRMLLALSNEEAHILMVVMQSPHHHHGHVDLSGLQDLYARYPNELSTLGFSTAKNRQKREVTWRPQSSDSVYNMEVALIGLFHNGGGLEAHI